jgi:hypothetical protein
VTGLEVLGTELGSISIKMNVMREAPGDFSVTILCAWHESYENM